MDAPNSNADADLSFDYPPEDQLTDALYEIAVDCETPWAADSRLWSDWGWEDRNADSQT